MGPINGMKLWVSDIQDEELFAVEPTLEPRGQILALKVYIIVAK